MGDCLFCKIAKKEIPSDIIYSDDKCIAFMDIKPQAPVHFLVVPRKHIEKLSDIKKEDSELISHLIFVANSLAHKKSISKSGFRVVINCNKDAGQEIFHIHVHVLGGRIMRWPPG